MKNLILNLILILSLSCSAQQTELTTPSGAFTLQYHGHIDGHYTGMITNNLQCTEEVWISWNDGEGDSTLKVQGKSGQFIKIKAKYKGNSIIRVGTPSKCGKKEYEVTCFVAPPLNALPLRQPELAGPAPKPIPEKDLAIINMAGELILKTRTRDSYFKVISTLPTGSYVILEGTRKTKMIRL